MPFILVTNDDGIQSPGIKLLADALCDLGEVLVVAPSRQQSAVSRKITLSEPLRVLSVGSNRVAVSGTPADSVFVALHHLCKRPPDLVVSGVNLGGNLGTDLHYSGTVAGALEATMQGISALAISQLLPKDGQTPADNREEAQKANWWDPIAEGVNPSQVELLRHAAAFATELARHVLRNPLPAGVALNVNLPPRESSRFRWTRIGQRAYRGDIVERSDPRGIPYYWIGGEPDDLDEPPKTDSSTIFRGEISISPVRVDWNSPRPSAWDSFRPDGFRREAD